MALTLSKEIKESKDTKSGASDDVKSEDGTKVDTPKEVLDTPSPTTIIIDALSTIKSKIERYDHKHKEKILTKIKGAIELLSQN